MATEAAIIGDRSALVLFSGGQDSATCLAWALDRFDHVETLGSITASATGSSSTAGGPARRHGPHRPGLGDAPRRGSHGRPRRFGQNLRDGADRDAEIGFAESGLPNTFVPGRNLVFLTFAAALAYRRGIRHVVGGMCETDYSAIRIAGTTRSRRCRSR